MGLQVRSLAQWDGEKWEIIAGGMVWCQERAGSEEIVNVSRSLFSTSRRVVNFN